MLLLALGEVSGLDKGDAHDSSSLRQSRGYLVQQRQWRVRRENPINGHFSCAAFQLVEEITVSRFGNVDQAGGSRCRISGSRGDWDFGRRTGVEFLHCS